MLRISGTIVHVLDEEQGASWRRQTYVLETDGRYPKKIAFELWNDKIDNFELEVGDVVSASIDISSREWNGKWYTNVSAYNVQSKMLPKTPEPEPERDRVPGEDDDTEDNVNDDIPF